MARPLPGAAPVSGGQTTPETSPEPTPAVAAPGTQVSGPTQAVEIPLPTTSPEAGRVVAERDQSLAMQFVTDLEAAPTAAADEVGEAMLDAQRTQSAVNEMTLRQVQDLQRDAMRRQAEVDAARRDGRPLPPLSAQAVAATADGSLMIDRDGKPAGTPGRVKRWVRMRDSFNNPSSARAAQLARDGYTPIKSRVDGQPIVDSFGIAMEAPVEADASRRSREGRDRIALPEQMRKQAIADAEQDRGPGGRVIGTVFDATPTTR